MTRWRSTRQLAPYSCAVRSTCVSVAHAGVPEAAAADSEAGTQYDTPDDPSDPTFDPALMAVSEERYLLLTLLRWRSARYFVFWG